MADNEAKIIGKRAWDKLTEKDEVTLGVAIITRNRIDQLKRLLPQLIKMDQVVVCDTGSQDGTERYVRSLGKPFQYIKFPWRDRPTKKNPDFGFSAARNASFDALKTTHGIWLDTDDMVGVMKGNKPVLASPDQIYGVFKKIATTADSSVDVWYINYVYGRDLDGNPISVNTRERMVKLAPGWRWVWPIHENLVPVNHERRAAEVSDIDIIHFPDEVVLGSAERNLKISQIWLEFMEENGGPEYDLQRCKLNIGESLNALGRWKESADFLVKRFLSEHPRALDMEKWHAWVMVASAQLELANFEAAKAAAFACIDIEPGLSDGYYLLAQAKFLSSSDPQDVLLVLETAATKEEPPSQMIVNPLNYTFTPFCIASDCKFQLGQYDEALKFALKAQAIAPHDERAEKLRIKAADAVRKRDTVEAVKALYTLLKDYEENEKAAKLYDFVPYTAQQNAEIQELARMAYQRVRHLYDRSEYIKLYENPNHWIPSKEEWIEMEAPPGWDRYMWLLGRLKAALPNGGRVLDVGCSDGQHSLLFAKHGYEVVGVDLSPEAIKIANERAEKLNLPARFFHGFFEDMEPTKMVDPFDLDRNWFQNFDAVIAGEVIEHVQDPALFLGCLGDCAKDGAPILLTTPDEAFDKGEIPVGGGSDDTDGMIGHVRAFTQESFEGLLRSNSEFDVVESHFVPITTMDVREHQGWQVGEIRRRDRASGPVIRIFCGDNTKFSPDDVNLGGIGGSETAVIYMAKAWQSMGCQVVVYTAGENGIYDGVWYRNSSLFDIKHKSDVFISWRIPTAFQYGRPNATTTIFWCHDLGYPIQLPGLAKNEFPKAWVDAMDYVMVVSKFHQKYIEKFHPCLKGKTFVTRNGINPARFARKDIKKVPHRYFYSSSYDRGLEELLAVWPAIKKAIPDAELHVAYGMQVAIDLCLGIGDMQRLNWLYSIESKMKQLPGIVAHDRIGQQELAELQMSCEAWLYPPQPNRDGGWLETYCITALEAQAAKCKIISRDNGALPETIKHALWWHNQGEQTADWIVAVLQNLDEKWDKVWTKENYDWAMSQTWDGVALEWARELSKKSEEKETVSVN